MWRDRVEMVFTELRAAYLRHPNAATLVQTATSASPALLDPIEATLEALADAGLPTGTALSAWTALVAFTNGHAGYQIHGHLLGGTRDALAIDDDRFPHVARAIAGDFGWDHAFRKGSGGSSTRSSTPPRSGASRRCRRACANERRAAVRRRDASVLRLRVPTLRYVFGADQPTGGRQGPV
ncbi:MAG TPA: TetR/AcrR family transcriptional regulator C-terminal domain-containing protein, partial [Euzebyales bacterium]|nr:TetR/AcrR family transcriptional regulator C-terminal domain-containing protein [Euzebyales bacterium]